MRKADSVAVDGENFAKPHPEGVTLRIRVQPRARRCGVTGVSGNSLKIAVPSPPVDGKANDALRRYLAKTLGVSKSSVSIVRGETAREKLVAVRGIDRGTAVALLQPR